MRNDRLHRLIQRGDLVAVRELLISREGAQINAPDRQGYPPLIRAVESPVATPEMIQLLLDSGADIHQVSEPQGYLPTDAIRKALGRGDPAIIRLLVERGGDLHYQAKDGYSALIDAVHSRDVIRDKRLIELLRLLIAYGVDLNGITTYGESGLRVLSWLGRFDAVKLLLEAGADEGQLQWTPLLRAIALGSLAEVQRELATGGPMEARDWWQRTAWLLAISPRPVCSSSGVPIPVPAAGAESRCFFMPSRTITARC